MVALRTGSAAAAAGRMCRGGVTAPDWPLIESPGVNAGPGSSNKDDAGLVGGVATKLPYFISSEGSADRLCPDMGIAGLFCRGPS